MELENLQTKQDAINWVAENGRVVVTLEGAKIICNLTGLDFNKLHQRTTRGYRENVLPKDENTPRIDVEEIAEKLGEHLGIKPDEKTMETANAMLGIGSACDLATLAYLKEAYTGDYKA